MKILVVTQYYGEENYLITETCEELVKRGNFVTVLTGLPNYNTGYVSEEYRNGSHNREIVNGVEIIRCYEIGRKKGIINLCINYLSFWISSNIKIDRMNNDYDVVLGYQLSPIVSISSGLKYSLKNNTKFVIWCLDIWPESMKVYIKTENNILFRIMKKISKKIYSSADSILCSSISFIDYLIETHNIYKDKITYLPQFGDDSLLEADFTPIDNGICDLVFLGNVGKEQNLENIVKALFEIRDRNFIFHIVGDGSDLENVKKVTENLDMNDKVKFYGRRPKEEMIKFYKLADACILSLRCKNKIGLTLPNKLQSYMAAGKFVLGIISGSAKHVIDESRCGLCVEGNDYNGFIKNVLKLINNKCELTTMSKNAKMYYINNFSKTIVIKRLEENI